MKICEDFTSGRLCGHVTTLAGCGGFVASRFSSGWRGDGWARGHWGGFRHAVVE